MFRTVICQVHAGTKLDALDTQRQDCGHASHGKIRKTATSVVKRAGEERLTLRLCTMAVLSIVQYQVDIGCVEYWKQQLRNESSNSSWYIGKTWKQKRFAHCRRHVVRSSWWWSLCMPHSQVSVSPADASLYPNPSAARHPAPQ